MNKPAAQLSLEAIVQTNQEKARKLLEENERILSKMNEILSEPPPPISVPQPMSKLMEAFVEGVRKSQPPSAAPPVSVKLTAEKEVIFAALAIVRSWQRRHKKNWRAQEKELAVAVEKLTWTE